MKEYRVEWTIDIEADTPREAAEKALAIQRDGFSRATVFDVHEKDADEGVTVDLEVGEDFDEPN
jgi:hypothetical protein